MVHSVLSLIRSYSYILKIFRYIPCWPVNVPHSVGGSTFARVAVAPLVRLPAPGVSTRLSPSAQDPVVSAGCPIVVEIKSSLI